jgi:hypothetical protein
MKYLFIIIALLTSGCSDDNRINELIHQQAKTQFQLTSCENSLSVYRSPEGSTVQDVTPASPSEPQYQEVTIYHVLINGKTVNCETMNDGRDVELNCGAAFSDCDNGFNYQCLQNVQYKIIKEKREIKE